MTDPAKCEQCGFTGYELDVMDFGPFVGQLICDECWSATEPSTT